MVSAAIWIVSFLVVATFVVIVIMLLIGVLSNKTAREILGKLVFGVIVLIVLYLITNSSKQSCYDEATAKSVSAYPYSLYPETQQRSYLQNTYKQSYIANNCR